MIDHYEDVPAARRQTLLAKVEYAVERCFQRVETDLYFQDKPGDINHS